ncbi:MAG: FHA domain-containing protein [Candidatus Symbiothrix sp.]|jgi:hypothetical protein|nr:FHA domain-containing protein [Candidatus Symbiothrix sp.]
MRCKNCGWDNPDENTLCEKCGNALGGNAGEAASSAKQTPAESYESRKTAVGCPHCGYPVRPGDSRCPQCDSPLSVKETAKETAIAYPANGGGTRLPGMNGAPAEGRRLAGLLITYSLNPLGDFFPVYEGKNTVGRDSGTNIRLNGDTLVSGKHLTILYRAVDKKFKFKDEQSSNGTFINDNLLDEGELANGDIIRVGNTRLLFFAVPEF